MRAKSGLVADASKGTVFALATMQVSTFAHYPCRLGGMLPLPAAAAAALHPCLRSMRALT